MKSCHVLWGIVAASVVAVAANRAQAVTVSASGTTTDGKPISATLDFTVSGNVATVMLTNTTLNTLDAGQLLTGVDLTFSGGGSVSLSSGTGTARTVDGSGAFSDSGPVNLMTAGPNNGPTWSVNSVNGAFRLNFNPDAKYAILGPPTDGSYSGANGSINGNEGHNPYLAQTGTFTLSASGITEADLTGVTFLFGTAFQNPLPGEVPPGGGAPPPVPEPASLFLLPLALAGLMLHARRRPV